MTRRFALIFGSIGLALVLIVLVSRTENPESNARHSNSSELAEPFQLRAISETRVNTHTASTQANSCVAVDPTGQSVVVWDSRRQQQGTYGIFLQRFDRDGKRIGVEQPVNLFQQNMQRLPAVAVDGTGGTWVVWESFGQDGSMGSIIARRFSGDHFQGSDEWLVNQTVNGHQSQAVVAADRKGNATIVWTNPATDDQPSQVVYRTFRANGTAVCDETPVHRSQQNQQRPSIAINANDQIMVVWAETSLDQQPCGIFAKPIGAKGRTARQVSLPDAAAQIEPSITACRDDFAIGWLRSTSQDYEVLFQQVNHRAEAIHGPVVASPPHSQRISGVALAPVNNQLLVAWNRSSDGAVGHHTIIEGRTYDRDGAATGQPLQINLDGNKQHFMTPVSGTSRIASHPQGPLWVVWNGNRENDESAVGLTALHHEASKDFALQAPEAGQGPVQPESSVARPHDPPTFNRRDIARDKFGGDRNPFARAGTTGFIGITSSGWTPPDPSVAVGPNHVVAMTNGAIAWFDKQGNQQFEDEIENSFGFWGSLGANNFVFDPEVLYDPHSGRFFAMACERSDQGTSHFLLAVSDDADPNGDWFKYRFDVTSLSDDNIDSPNMAVDANAVYLTADFFGPNRFLIYMLDKNDVITGVPNPPANDILITNEQSFGIAMNYDAAAPATYMIRGDEFVTSDTLHLSALTDPLGTPVRVTTDITVPTYGHPVDPVSLGTSTRPELFESRFWSCVYRNGSLWAVHHQSPDSSTDVARVRWYEIDMKGWPLSGDLPELVQSGDIHPDANTYTYFPSIWVDDDGHAAITFAKSSSTEFISMCRAIRVADDPAGSFRPWTTVRTNAAAYNGGRWGDYSGTVNDPDEREAFWGMHEYSPGSNSWNTWIQKYEIPVSFAYPGAEKFLDGVATAGTLDDIRRSNDQYLEIDPSPTLNPRKQIVEVIFQSSTPVLQPTGFGFRFEARMIGGPVGDVIQTLNLFDQELLKWEVVDVRAASDVDVNLLIQPAGDVSRFVNPLNGEITAQLTWESPQFSGTPFIWSIDLDQAHWRIEK